MLGIEEFWKNTKKKHDGNIQKHNRWVILWALKELKSQGREMLRASINPAGGLVAPETVQIEVERD